jgi:hypothetical protein
MVDLLVMHSNYEGQLTKGDLKDNFIVWKEFMWYTERTSPIRLDGLMGKKNLYIVKTDKCVPATLDEIKKLAKDGVPTDLKAHTPEDILFENLTPQMMKSLLQAKIVGGMLKTKRGTGGGIGQNAIVMLGIGLAIGVIAFQLLTKFNLIPK